MRTKILIGTVVGLLAATSLYAASSSCNYSDNQMGSGMHNQSMHNQAMKSHSKQYKHSGYGMHTQSFHQKGKQGFKMHKMFQALNLTSQQQTKMDTIIKKHRNSKAKMSDAFTKTGFDKAKFIELTSQKRDNMIKKRII